MGHPRIKLLDHGYVELVETWGSDERVVEAARMSTGKGFLGWGTSDACQRCGGSGRRLDTIEIWDEAPEQVFVGPGKMRLVGGRKHREQVEVDCECGGKGAKPGDEKLLRFLWENQHATPFEMAGAIFEIKAPIMVFREWHRHRTQSYNEMSARYTPLPDENYVPSVERLMIGSDGKNRQAGTIAGAGALTRERAEWFRERLRAVYEGQQSLYEDALHEGVPKELARVHLPVGRYSRMRASTNLRNWLAFLTLRMAASAQWEIRQYANTVYGALAIHFPRTLALFDEGARR